MGTPDGNRPPSAMLAAFLAALFFALSAAFAHRTTRLVGVRAANFARLSLAGAMLAIWAHGFGGGLHGAGLPVFIVSGAVGFGMGDLGLFAALPLLGSRLTSLMVQCLAAPLAALIEWLWLGTRLEAPELLCGGTILLGVALAVAPERQPVEIATEPRTDRNLGLIYGVIAATGQAGGAVISRKAHAISHAAGFAVDGGTAAYQRAIGGLVVVGIAYALSHHQPKATAPTWKLAWPWIVANSLAGAVLGVSCYQWALSTTPTGIVMPIVALTPLLVVPLAYFLEHERPCVRSLMGGAVAVAATATLAWFRR